MRAKQILWDWNGTLIDDLQYAIDVRNRVFPAFGLPTVDSVEAYHQQFTFPVRIYYERAGVTDDLFDEVAHAWMNEYVRGFEQVRLHEDALPTLERFRDAGWTQVMLSASKRDLLRAQVDSFGILPFFTAVLGLGDIYAGSKEDIGRAYLAECAIPAGQTVMLGDSLHDAEVARAIGAQCILVARGHQSRKTLLTSGFPVAATLCEAANSLLTMS